MNNKKYQLKLLIFVSTILIIFGFNPIKDLLSFIISGGDMIAGMIKGITSGEILNQSPTETLNQAPSNSEIITTESQQPQDNNSNIASNQNTTTEDSSSLSFELNPTKVNFPLKKCHQSLPKDHRAYPIYLENLFIPYSENNLKLVQSKFCQDAFVTQNEKGEKLIQIASAVYSIDLNFEELITKKFADAETKDIIIENKPNYVPIKTEEKYIKSVAEKALLTPKQAQTLVSSGKGSDVYYTRLNTPVNTIKFTRQIVVPTYLPSGFKVDDLYINDPDYYSGIYYYNNQNNTCFSISSFLLSGIGSGETDYDIVTVMSKIFGKVFLEYTSSSKIGYESYIGTSDGYISIGGFQGYNFSSPPNKLYYDYNRECQSISLKDAVKIVESLQYLSP